MKKICNQGEQIPPFYGVAYYDYVKGQAVCYPLFINLIVLLYRDTLRFFKWPKGTLR